MSKIRRHLGSRDAERRTRAWGHLHGGSKIVGKVSNLSNPYTFTSQGKLYSELLRVFSDSWPPAGSVLQSAGPLELQHGGAG